MSLFAGGLVEHVGAGESSSQPDLVSSMAPGYLRDARHADAMLCRLVAHHSCAIIKAGERGLAGILSCEFDPAPDVLASVLRCCDMTTSPDGQPCRSSSGSLRYVTATPRGTW